jgi:hypothetical protein
MGTELVIVMLATAFGVAGALKLLVPRRGPTLASRFAARGRIEALSVASLPWLEFTLAGALLVPQFRRAGAITCLLLLLVFTAVMLSSSRGANALPCGCFGSAEGNSSWWPYARNSSLALLAVVSAVGGHPRGSPEILALMVVASIGVFTSAVLGWELRRYGMRAATVLSRASGTEVLETAREQALATTDGKSTSINHWLSTARPHVIVFVDPLCGPCHSLLPALAAQQQASGAVAVAIISRGPMPENAAMAREFGLAPIAVAPDDSVVRRLGMHATPSALLITAKGRIVYPPAVGRAAILELLARTEPLAVD